MNRFDLLMLAGHEKRIVQDSPNHFRMSILTGKVKFNKTKSKCSSHTGILPERIIMYSENERDECKKFKWIWILQVGFRCPAPLSVIKIQPVFTEWQCGIHRGPPTCSNFFRQKIPKIANEHCCAKHCWRVYGQNSMVNSCRCRWLDSQKGDHC